MKQFYLYSLLTAFLFMVGLSASAFDIEVRNGDGVTIYYNYANNETELSVTYGECTGQYSGAIVIPSTVTYNNKTCSVTSIGSQTFYGCSGLTSVTIPNSVTTIGASAFRDCIKLSSISIGKGLKRCDYYVFRGCENLKEVHISDLKSWCEISCYTDGNPMAFAHHLFLNGVEVKGDLVIPEGTSSIGGSAFYGIQELTSVSIPSSVVSIGDAAFRGCSNLVSVNLTEGLQEIGRNVFMGCSSLTSITLPNSLTDIDDGSFMLTGIKTPLYNSTCFAFMPIDFSGKYTIPSGIQTICGDAFKGCSKITEIEMLEGVTRINIGAFSSCSNLKKIIIPESIANIESDIIASSKPEHIYCYAEILPATSNHLFRYSSPSTITLHVPASVLDLYKQTSPWSACKEIVPIGIDDGIDFPKFHIENHNVTYYDFNGCLILISQHGLNIIRMSDGTVKKVVVRSAMK